MVSVVEIFAIFLKGSKSCGRSEGVLFFVVDCSVV